MFEEVTKKRRLPVAPAGAAVLTLFCAARAAGAESDAVTTGSLAGSVDTLWVMLTAFLVFFMQAGFGMLEAGFTRAKNAANILMKNMMDFSVGAIGFWFIGFALMFGVGNRFFGTSLFFLNGAPDQMFGVPTQAFWFFQAVFAAAAATIVAGAMAERTKFLAYLIYSFIISSLIYPIIGHWIWGGGWLSELGYLDFAGSSVVHAVGGFASMAGAYVLGPRIGKYGPDGTAHVIPGHSLPLAALGTLILWFGWFGFNPGSTLSGLNGGLIASIAVNTHVAAAAGALTSMAVVWLRYGRPDLSMSLNGALAGLVAVTASCAYISMASAAIIGLTAGLVVVWGVYFLDRIKLDDPVGAIPVHGFCGVWGTLAVGLFHRETGLFVTGSFRQLAVQAAGVLAVIAFVLITMYGVFRLIDRIWGLRVSRDEELKGLDIGEHGIESYSGFQIFTTE
jgi:Amt family ammonium transporter